MFQIVKPNLNIDFMSHRFKWLAVSLVAIVGTFILLGTKGLNYGIDFTGGAEIQIRVPESWETGQVRQALEKGGIRDSKVQHIGEDKSGQFLIKVQGNESTLNQAQSQVNAALATQLKKGEYEMQRVDVVGPAAGSSLRTSGFLSMFYALLCILIYVTVRFDFRYAPGAVLALFHDTIITIGIYVLTQKQFDLQILAALLALIGYSNNDTIIVYDRVRETIAAHPHFKIEDAVNRAINETLGRTILTSGCTFLTVLSLWLFGGKVIEDFAFTLMVGIIIGTYSSIVIASSVLIVISHYQDGQKVRSARPRRA